MRGRNLGNPSCISAVVSPHQPFATQPAAGKPLQLDPPSPARLAQALPLQHEKAEKTGHDCCSFVAAVPGKSKSPEQQRLRSTAAPARERGAFDLPSPDELAIEDSRFESLPIDRRLLVALCIPVMPHREVRRLGPGWRCTSDPKFRIRWGIKAAAQSENFCRVSNSFVDF